MSEHYTLSNILGKGERRIPQVPVSDELCQGDGPIHSSRNSTDGLLWTPAGAFGIVYEAEHRASGERRACKCIAKAKLVGEEDLEDVRREVQVLQMVGQHDNVAELLGVYEDQRNVYLVLELCKGGELFDRIVSKGTFTEKMVGHCMTTVQCHQGIASQHSSAVLCMEIWHCEDAAILSCSSCP